MSKKIRPLLVILSPRNIPHIIEKISEIDYVDKLWVKYYSLEDAFAQVLIFFNEHREYTHLVINGDDGAPDYNHLAMLIADVKKYNLPIVSGCCPIDALKDDWFLNVTLRPVVNKDYQMFGLINQPFQIDSKYTSWQPVVTEKPMHTNARTIYQALPNEFRKLNGIIRVWFEGQALAVIRRDIIEKVGLLWNKDTNLPKWTKVGDLGFALQCEIKKVPQYVDLRCYYLHEKHYEFPYNILIGKENPYIKFERAKKKIPLMDPAPMVYTFPEKYCKMMEDYYYYGSKPPTRKILLITPFCNEEHSIHQYVHSLLSIDYPKELIDIVWIENHSSDNTWSILKDCKAEMGHRYRSFRLFQMGLGFKLPKAWLGEKGAFGGKISATATPEMKKARSEFLVDVWNFGMSLLDDQDYVLFHFADVVVPSNIIRKYIKDLIDYPDCGWIGGVMHKRFPNHILKDGGNPMVDGLACPIFYINDDDPTPKYQSESNIYRLKNLREEFQRRETWNAYTKFFNGYMSKFPKNEFPYRSGFYTATEQEILALQKIKGGIHEACLTYHVWMMRPEIVKLGIKFQSAPYETGIAFEHDMHKHGYKICVDTNIYIKHISLDGKIYRTGLFPEDVLEEKKEKPKESKSSLKKEEPMKYYPEPRQGPHP